MGEAKRSASVLVHGMRMVFTRKGKCRCGETIVFCPTAQMWFHVGFVKEASYYEHQARPSGGSGT